MPRRRILWEGLRRVAASGCGPWEEEGIGEALDSGRDSSNGLGGAKAMNAAGNDTAGLGWRVGEPAATPFPFCTPSLCGR